MHPIMATWPQKPMMKTLAGGRAFPAGASCFEKSDSAATWITVASIVQSSNNLDAFIERFGSVSTLLAVRCWSTSEQKWRPLVLSASAIASTNATAPRADYSLAELSIGRSPCIGTSWDFPPMLSRHPPLRGDSN